MIKKLMATLVIVGISALVHASGEIDRAVKESRDRARFVKWACIVGGEDGCNNALKRALEAIPEECKAQFGLSEEKIMECVDIKIQKLVDALELEFETKD